jgi:hypothetical protein
VKRQTILSLVFASVLAPVGPVAAEEPPEPLLEVGDWNGPMAHFDVVLRSDGVLVRDVDLTTVEESRLTPREWARIEAFMTSPRFRMALEELDAMPGPANTDTHDVMVSFQGEVHGYTVSCRPPSGAGLELMELLNDILAAHFGQHARLHLTESSC